ncbi:MAG: hypothetical protein LBV59_11645 [Sphingobacterium sp.]|jgi:hypothetical protein|uniref:hypothetical protein n=1 Tax=Sphingobacterium sp. TaxID=341027 RepID=UPI0028505981|nr:hypothetical protein [Sphingobacterium sp.]MDR3008581.1 hypothetical protein [Sphingobacterium sp.]
MTNRIFKWWDDVQKWKEKFEKMFPSWFIESKEFQKAELAKLRSIIHSKTGKLSEEEKLSKKILQGYYNKFEREVYPTYSSRISARIGNYLQTVAKSLIERIRNMQADSKKAIAPSSSDVSKLLREFEQSKKLNTTTATRQAAKVTETETTKGKVIEFPKAALRNNGRKRRL